MPLPDPVANLQGYAVEEVRRRLAMVPAWREALGVADSAGALARTFPFGLVFALDDEQEAAPAIGMPAPSDRTPKLDPVPPFPFAVVTVPGDRDVSLAHADAYGIGHDWSATVHVLVFDRARFGGRTYGEEKARFAALHNAVVLGLRQVCQIENPGTPEAPAATIVRDFDLAGVDEPDRKAELPMWVAEWSVKLHGVLV